MESPPPGTIVVWSDLACPWAHVAVGRLHRVRAELCLGDVVRFDHRAFPLEVAAECDDVAPGALAESLDDGRCRRAVMDQAEEAAGGEVQGSPHLFLPDGTDVHNPGVELHWAGKKGRGFPVVDADHPSVYGDILRRSARPAEG